MGTIIKLPQLAWDGVSDLTLSLPEEWGVEVCNMTGYNRQALTETQIREAVQNPHGSDPLRILAKDRKQVVIIFDDMARATRSARIVPFILEELAEAGILDTNIRFIGATGCHGVMSRPDFVKKLGQNIVRRFPVYNHNAFGHCVKVGTTSLGVEIWANGEVMKCDLKIAIGTVAPHPAAGFGGGEKIVLPGICSFETNAAFHQTGMEVLRRDTGRSTSTGNAENNPHRLNMLEAARMVGLDITIDTISNSYGEPVAVYAGKPEISFPEAINDARNHYLTRPARDKDIVIANTFHKASELESGCDIAFDSVKREGGDVVLIGNCPGGHVTHYLFGAWGNTRHPFQMRHGPPLYVNHLYILNEYPDRQALGYFTDLDKVSMSANWTEILAALTKRHGGQARVAVYPNADVQYCGD